MSRSMKRDSMPTKMVSKENSIANSSMRVLYYGNATGAIPFVWESQPGTPKHSLSCSSLNLPLTPPPCHHSKNSSSTVHFFHSASAKSSSTVQLRQSSLRRTISFLSGKNSKRAHLSPSSSVSSCSSWSSADRESQTPRSSSTSTRMCCVGGSGRRVTWRWFFGGARWLM